MNYNYLHYFKVLARTQHYTKAAEILNITQPSLSHAISEIESELGVKLFEKTGRNIRLNKYGIKFNEYVSRGLNDIDDGIKAIKTMSGKDTGIIDIGFIYTLGSYYVPNIIQSYLSNQPNIKFKLKQGVTDQLLQSLQDGEIDIAFTSFSASYTNINFFPILNEEIVLIVSNTHPLATYNEIDLRTISSDESWILYSNNSGLRPYLNNVFETCNIKPKIKCEVEEDNTVFGLVDINFGIALVPYLAITNIHNVKAIHIKNEIPDRKIYLATMKNHYMTQSTISFMNYIIYNTFDNLKIQK